VDIERRIDDKERDAIRCARSCGMKILADNRNLSLGLIFVLATLLVWTRAREIYRERLAGVQSQGRLFNVTLKEVTQFRALFPDRSVEQWLGPKSADAAHQQLKRFQWTFAAALLCGFFAVFCLGLHIDRFERIT
jgi:hypothetical protein